MGGARLVLSSHIPPLETEYLITSTPPTDIIFSLTIAARMVSHRHHSATCQSKEEDVKASSWLDTKEGNAITMAAWNDSTVGVSVPAYQNIANPREMVK